MQENLWGLWVQYWSIVRYFLKWPFSHEIIFLVVWVIPVVISAASAIGQRHSRELYLLWYIFSFFFLLFLALNLAARWTDQELNDFLGKFALVYGWLTNGKDELLFAAGIIYLGIGPQLLTYLLSGLFGSASSPIFVRQIETTAILSLVKFLMALSGIRLAAAFASLSFGEAASTNDLAFGLLALGSAFLLAGFHFCGFGWFLSIFVLIRKTCAAYSIWILRWLFKLILPSRVRHHSDSILHSNSAPAIRNGRLRRGRIVTRLRSIHRFFTRHSEPTG